MAKQRKLGNTARQLAAIANEVTLTPEDTIRSAYEAAKRPWWVRVWVALGRWFG